MGAWLRNHYGLTRSAEGTLQGDRTVLQRAWLASIGRAAAAMAAMQVAPLDLVEFWKRSWDRMAPVAGERARGRASMADRWR